MKTSPAQIITEPSAAIEKIYHLERTGRYEKALAAFSEIRQKGENPDVSEFEPRTAAEILLRCGAVIGFWGHIRQISESQENSKNILTDARTRFSLLDNLEKVAECETYLALAYWRTGELGEAELWIKESLSHRLPPSNLVRLYSIVVKSVVNLEQKKYIETLNDLRKNESDFLTYADAFLMGGFCTNYGLALKNLGNVSDAFRKIESARYYHQKSGHKIYLGTVENNLALLYKAEKHYDRAHDSINQARNIFRKLNDKSREGFCLDTKAHIYFDEGKFKKALDTVEKAEAILRGGDNRAYLVETLSTKTKILLHLEDATAAVLCLSDAVHLAKLYLGEDSARKLITDYAQSVEEKREQTAIAAAAEKQRLENQSGAEFFELLLPPVLAGYQSVEGVWISNSYLEKSGLNEGSMAIIAHEKVERGDLAAVIEIASGEVICGFYDAEFGIICLATPDGEPQLFNENEIEILGKIIGVSNNEKDSQGKLLVEPIKI